VYGLLRRDTLPPPEGGWKFSTSGHRNTYNKHLKSLAHLKDTNDIGLSVLLVTIYRKCRFVSSLTIYKVKTHDVESSGITDSITIESEGLVKGIDAAALPRTYDSTSAGQQPCPPE
jgi:hypothetical protein